MAHDAGADLVNLEFLQLMLGFELPSGHKVICNEKLWRHSDVLDERGISVFEQIGASREEGRAALEAHSWHGPFTTARESRLLELAVQAAASHGHQAYLHVSEEFLSGVRPEFVDTYLDWLRRRGVDPKASVPITLYAHSCNGGIAIDAHGATSVPGLYAAGECTGGVHGADRIGGLASVTALVFGRRAGREAAHYALGHTTIRSAPRLASPFYQVSDTERIMREVGKVMDEHCLVNRTEQGLREVIQRMNDLYDECCAHEKSLLDIACPQEALKSFRARGKLVAARLMAEAMLGRRSSLGSHHRADSMC
jgi:L-aspartate oxidase